MTGYNDPKVTKPATGGGSGRTMWIAGAAVIVLLALAWAFGLFGGAGDGMQTTDPAAVTEQPAAGAPADSATTPVEPAEPAAPVE